MNFQWIKEYLGDKASRPAGNNRRYVKTGNDFGYLLHETIVVWFKANGDLVLNNGGWFSVTSKKAMNEALSEHGYGIFVVKGHWFIRVKATGEELVYENGMTVKGGAK